MSRLRLVVVVVFGAGLALAASLLPPVGQTVPVLLPAGGAAPDASSTAPVLSGNGHVAAFVSLASNLLPADGDGLRDIDLVDLVSGAAECVSVSSGGTKADADCLDPALDRKGRHVAFSSVATNLVAGDTNGVQDVFVRDRLLGTTVRVSVAGATQADGPSEQPSLSANGRLVAFASTATNLVGDDTNGVSDIFLHDLQTGSTTRISMAGNGAQAGAGSFQPKLSASGRWLAFLSNAANLVFSDGNNLRDVFVRDLKTGAVVMASVSTASLVENGASGVLSISDNGRWVAFDSVASNLTFTDVNAGDDVFVRDLKLHTTTLVSSAPAFGIPDGDSDEPTISGNGRWVVFTSLASNFVEGDTNAATDVFRRDLKTGTTMRVSVSSGGAEGDADSTQGTVSRNGRYVAFSTRATNLLQAATGGVGVIVLRRP